MKHLTKWFLNLVTRTSDFLLEVIPEQGASSILDSHLFMHMHPLDWVHRLITLSCYILDCLLAWLYQTLPKMHLMILFQCFPSIRWYISSFSHFPFSFNSLCLQEFTYNKIRRTSEFTLRLISHMANGPCKPLGLHRVTLETVNSQVTIALEGRELDQWELDHARLI